VYLTHPWDGINIKYMDLPKGEVGVEVISLSNEDEFRSVFGSQEPDHWFSYCENSGGNVIIQQGDTLFSIRFFQPTSTAVVDPRGLFYSYTLRGPLRLSVDTTVVQIDAIEKPSKRARKWQRA
jgi:hypothetical protein